MPLSRQVRYFKSSRDNWRNKALEKQEKIRVLEQRVRDLEKSREQWKSKAKQAEQKLKEREKQRAKELKKNEETQDNYQLRKVSFHHYSLKTIQISVQQVISGRSSYRSVEMNLKLLSQDFEVATTVKMGKRKIEKWLTYAYLFFGATSQTIKKHIVAICQYFVNGTTSGVMEGLNNKIKLILRQSYGFKNFDLMREKLLACLGK